MNASNLLQSNEEIKHISLKDRGKVPLSLEIEGQRYIFDYNRCRISFIVFTFHASQFKQCNKEQQFA